MLFVCAILSNHSLFRTSVKSMVASYLTLYAQDPPRWTDTSECVSLLGFTSQVAQTASEFLDSKGIASHWTREVVEAATRVNYAQVSRLSRLGDSDERGIER